MTRALGDRPRPGERVHLAGGPLDDCVIYVRRGSVAVLVPAHRGRYVRVDGDEWSWEIDCAPTPPAVPPARYRHRTNPPRRQPVTAPLYDVRTVGWAARDLPEPAASGVTLAEAHAAIDALAAHVVTSRDHGTDGALYEIRVRAAR